MLKPRPDHLPGGDVTTGALLAFVGFESHRGPSPSGSGPGPGQHTGHGGVCIAGAAVGAGACTHVDWASHFSMAVAEVGPS